MHIAFLNRLTALDKSPHTGQFYSSFKESKTEIVELLAKALFKSVPVKTQN